MLPLVKRTLPLLVKRTREMAPTILMTSTKNCKLPASRKEPGMQKCPNFFLSCNIVSFLSKTETIFAILSGKLSVSLHGQIYSYMYKTPRRGQKGPCCRLTRQKCYEDKWKRKICDTKWGRTRCGKGCTKLVETLERTAKWKERQEKNLEKIKEEKRMKKIRNMVMNMIQSTTKVRKTSTNPLCKDTRNTLR